jgi:hypothetical protein
MVFSASGLPTSPRTLSRVYRLSQHSWTTSTSRAQSQPRSLAYTSPRSLVLGRAPRTASSRWAARTRPSTRAVSRTRRHSPRATRRTTGASPSRPSPTAARLWAVARPLLTLVGVHHSTHAACAHYVFTGTTLVYIPDTAYSKFLSASGGKTDSNTGLASWTTAPTGTFSFTIASTKFTLTPSQYLFPTAQYR